MYIICKYLMTRFNDTFERIVKTNKYGKFVQ